jgi:3-hydroxyacyl-CoA dehydrogenase/enoyl-CoA hydratase/3-hydroxybutyryl-CoA epimerase
MSAFSYAINREGIAVLTFDLPGEKVNKLTVSVMDELNALLDELAVHREIKALVFRSGKEESFIAGADIGELRDITDPEMGEHLALKGQAILNKLEALPFPAVAAIHGPCMGGGMELALACSYRVISNDQRTALALPEVKLGIIPGFGGTQRLPRLVGLVNALDMILSGKPVYPKKAKRIGLADEVTFKETLLDVAVASAKKAIGKPHPERVQARHPRIIRLIEGIPLTRPLIYRAARRNVLRETRGNYPAPLAALESIRYGLAHGKEAGLVNEAKLVGLLAPTDVSKNLISVFYLNETLRRDPHPSLYEVSHAGVFGAGVMGGGIAQLLAERGITVRMKDLSTKAVGAGLKEAWHIFIKRQKKGILTAIQARDGFDRITGTADYIGFGPADLAVEAVVEAMDAKKNVLREFETVAREDAIFASNTSSLSITEMATASKHPDRVVGMHFFNPVEKMPLIEVVRGERTSDATVAAVATLARRIGKLPIVVKDGPGFLVNRILMPYLGEAVAMLEQGGDIAEIDRTLLQFGMPMGAFILLDEIGIDIAHKVSEILYQGLGARVKPSGLLSALYRDGYYGKKNGRGFYEYRGRKRGGPDTSLYRRALSGSEGKEKIGPQEIVDRPILLMIKEAALCLEDKIIDRPDLLDAALIFGIGFPAFRGGLLQYADRIGAKIIVEKLEGNAKKYGGRFDPPTSLVEMAKSGKGFYA